MADVLDAAAEAILASRDSTSLDEPLTFERMHRLIEAVLASGKDCRLLWYPSPLAREAFGAVAALWEAYTQDGLPEETPELAAHGYVLGYLAASGAGDYQYLIGGTSGPWFTASDKYRKDGLWNATNRALQRYTEITGKAISGAVPKRPGACLPVLLGLLALPVIVAALLMFLLL
jgi:hypothetical protein